MNRKLERFQKFIFKSAWWTVIAALLMQFIIPKSHVGYSSLTYWGDQSYFLKSLKQLEESKGEVVPGLMGMGYAAVARIFKIFFGSYEVSLVLISILSFSYTFIFLYRKIHIVNNSKVKFLFFLLVSSSYILLRIYQVSDIPWPHFLFAAIFFAAVYFYDHIKKNRVSVLIAIGFLTYTMWQTRNYETLAACLALAVCWGIFLLVNYQKISWHFMLAKITDSVSIGFGLALSWLTILVITNSTKQFSQFSNFPRPDLDLGRLIVKISAIFYNPTNGSLSEVNHIFWEPQLNNLVSTDIAKIWFQPLIKSQPILVPLILIALFAASILTIYTLTSRTSVFLMPLFCFYTSILIFIGFLTQPTFNQSQLKYGALREFIFPQFLIMLGLIEFYLRYEKNLKISKSTNFLVLPSLILIPVMLFFVSVLPQPIDNGFKQIRVGLNQGCVLNNSDCAFKIELRDDKGWQEMPSQPIEIRIFDNDRTTKFYQNDFSISKKLCSNGCKFFALPLSLGISETPESDAFFQKREKQWLTLENY